MDNPDFDFSIYYPKRAEHWFVGSVELEEGYNVFAFKCDPNELVTLLNFCCYTDNSTFWREGSDYGSVDIYIKESFPTKTEAMEFGIKIARDRKIHKMTWNQFPDPWEDK